MGKLGNLNTASDYAGSLEAAEHRRQGLGIVQELGHRVDNRWVGVEQSDQVVGIQVVHRQKVVDRNLDRLQHEHAHPQPCGRSPPPSCEPSTPFGFP